MKADLRSRSRSLALLGGSPALPNPNPSLFQWPIITREDEEAVLAVLRKGDMSGTEVTKALEHEMQGWSGSSYALGYCNGTSSLHAALWACGVGMGDEVIAPSFAYWGCVTAALSLGASVNFADSLPDSFNIDPADIEHRIGKRTKAIVVVHSFGYPCEMDEICDIAKRNDLKVIEDVSHAQGSLYRGRMCGTLGDIAGMSLMSGKSLVGGEAGMLLTKHRDLYERCIAFGHYERTGVTSNYNEVDCQVRDPLLLTYQGVPIGGYKHRMNQTCAAMARVQLRAFPERIVQIQAAMNRFWNALEGLSGVRPHRVVPGSGSTMGGGYSAKGIYRPEELGGLPLKTFVAALRAEGVPSSLGAYRPLHLHPVFQTADLFHTGTPTMVAFAERDVRQGPGSLPVAEHLSSGNAIFSVPWFKHDRPEEIGRYAEAFRKVVEHHRDLLGYDCDEGI